MRIQTRILILCSEMVFFSLFALLATNGLLFSFMRDEPPDRFLARQAAGESLFEAGQELSGEAAGKADWSALDESLAAYGFRAFVRSPSGDVFRAPESEERTAEYLRSLAPQGSGATALFMDNWHVMAAAREIVVGGVRYTAVAYEAGADERPEGKFAPVLADFLLAGFVSLFVILLLSQLFARGLVRRILTPVDLMIAGARRIERGDLTVPIEYASADEFGTLCESFNRMQEHLLSERVKNASYEKARIEMFADISHDIRTPLTSVKGFIKGLIDGVADTPEKRRRYLSIAYKKASDIDALLNKVSFFSKLETGNLQISAVRTDLGEYIGRFARDSYEDFDARVEFDWPGTWTSIYADIDPDNMKRVLNNLLENALKYAKADPVRVKIRLSQENGRAVIRFKDNGAGVPEDKLPHVFERFFRADEARSSKNSEGSGLGLYIVKHVVEAQGGTVDARNEGGFCVTISLPSM